MKRVLIFGSYNGGSIGDTAILLGLINSIESVLGKNIEITVLTMGPVQINSELEALNNDFKVNEIFVNKRINKFDFISYVHSRVLKKAYINERVLNEEIRKATLVLIGGGNLIMDLYQRWPQILKTVCKICCNYNKPYSLIGVGAAPIDTVKGRDNLSWCLNNAEYVFFRDEASKKYCESTLSFKRSSLIPDLALGLKSAPQKNNAEGEQLVVNLAAVYGKNWPLVDEGRYNLYIKSMCTLVEAICKKISPSKIVVICSNYPLDDLACKDFISQLEYNKDCLEIEYVDKRLRVAELINICKTAKLTFITRLHAGIIAHHGHSKVCAVSYQPKVKDVLLEMDITDVTLDIKDISDSKKQSEFIENILVLMNSQEDLLQNHSEKNIRIQQALNKVLSKG